MKTPLFAVLLALGVGTSAHYDAPLVPRPPGVIVQNDVAYLSGEAMNSKWRVVASRAGAQWYLSVYAPPAEDQRAHLVFRSPGNSPLLATVTRSRGAPLPFPFQSLRIAGAAELERPTVQDAVIELHESGADCGIAKVIILGADSRGHVRVRKTVSNYCDLEATIFKTGDDMQALRLRGPRYGARSPVCCPIEAHAAATLTGKGGKWRITPAIFPPPDSRLP